MYRIGIVLLPQAYLSSVSGVMDTFQIANAHIRNQQGSQAPQYYCETLSQTSSAIVFQGGVKLEADVVLDDAGHYGMIYIPAFFTKVWKALNKWRRNINRF